MPGWLQGIIVAIIVGGLPGWQAARASRKVKKLEAANKAREKADADRIQAEADRIQNERERLNIFEVAQRTNAEAFERAQRINNEIVAGLRDEIARLRNELADVRAQALTAEQRNIQVERRYAAMERSLLRMQTLVDLYVQKMRAAGLEVIDVAGDEQHATEDHAGE